jgi:hypothetical protein
MCRFSLPPGYTRRRPVTKPKLGALLAVIDGILEADRTGPVKQRHTAKRIFERLRDEQGCGGGYTVGEGLCPDRAGARTRDLRAAVASGRSRPGVGEPFTCSGTGSEGNDKGKVEGLVKYARANFMTPIPVAASFDDLNAMLTERCRARQMERAGRPTQTIGTRLGADLDAFRACPPCRWSPARSVRGLEVTYTELQYASEPDRRMIHEATRVRFSLKPPMPPVIETAPQRSGKGADHRLSPLPLKQVVS